MARRKTREQIEAQAERLSEANWRRRNTWSGGQKVVEQKSQEID